MIAEEEIKSASRTVEFRDKVYNAQIKEKGIEHIILTLQPLLEFNPKFDINDLFLSLQT